MTDTIVRPISKEGISDAALSWQAVAAGSVSAAALTLVLLAFGSAMGFSSVSPWSHSGVSTQTFHIATGLYLIVTAMLSSTIGGYIAGRMRPKWTGLQTHETQFRDTAHGFLAWAFATVLGAAALGTAATYFVGGAATTAAAVSATQSSNDYFVGMLFRPGPNQMSGGAAGNDAANLTRDAGIVFARDIVDPQFPQSDRAYLAQVVTLRTGLSQSDAEKRVTDTIDQAKAAADKARKAAAALSIWMTIAMLAGAFSASLAAIEGGQLRDGRWKGVIGARAYQRENA